MDLEKRSYCVGELGRMEEAETVVGKIDRLIYFQLKKENQHTDCALISKL